MSAAMIATPVQALHGPRLVEGAEPSDSEVQLALERVLRSSRFSRSERLRRFLQFVVRQKLAGRATDLKEYAIANEVYDRGPSFDPATDTIVRVEARRLRATLQAYYKSDGASDPIWIEVPKGGYQPLFVRRPRAGREQPAAPSTSSVAVLPFEDLSGGNCGDSFCRGLTDEVVCALMQIDGLRVAARGRVSSALHVARLVQGSVRQAGDRVRITAQLVNTADSYHVWSRRFDRELGDVFAIQDEVAAAIVEAFTEPRPQD